MNLTKLGGHVTHQKKEGSRFCTSEDDLNELIGTTYTNKINIFFGIPSLKNSIVKHVWLPIVMEWVTF